MQSVLIKPNSQSQPNVVMLLSFGQSLFMAEDGRTAEKTVCSIITAAAHQTLILLLLINLHRYQRKRMLTYLNVFFLQVLIFDSSGLMVLTCRMR